MSEPSAVGDFVRGDLHRLGVTLDDQQLAMLAGYLDLLLLTNQQFNLIAPTDRDEAWRRHIIDSLTLAPFLEADAKAKSLIDVGAGGGLPGIPLAIALPHLQVVLLEATGKKARFCQRCADELGIENITVVHDRAEHVGQQKRHREQYDVAVCRALGPMPSLLECTLPLVRVGGQLLAMKGPKGERELEQAANALDLLGGGDLQVYDAYPAGFDRHTVIVIVHKLHATPRQYPRPPGVPRHAPL